MKNSTQLKADLHLKFFSLAKKQVAGFSLIELSLTLIVVASLALIAMTKMVEENEIDRKIIVLDDLDKIKKAIQSFVARNGYYPCPSNPGHSSDAPEFALSEIGSDGGIMGYNNNKNQYCGNSNNFAAVNKNNNIPSILYIPSSAANKFELSSYTGSYNGGGGALAMPGDTPAPIAEIFKGDVPCKDIGLEPNCGVSPEGNKYSYIVSGHLTMVPRDDYFNDKYVTGCSKSCVWTGTPATYDEYAAARIKPVKVWDTTVGNLSTDYTANGFPEVDFAVIDHGKNGLGAYNTAGVRNSDVGATNYERLNFKQDATGYVNEFIYAPIQPNDIRTASSDNFFDDIVVLGKQDSTIARRYCVDCREWGGTSQAFPNSAPPLYTDQYMLLLNNITSCADPAIQTACEALP